MGAEGLVFRTEVTQEDMANVRAMTESTGFFYPEEVHIAVDLVEERLVRGPKCDYNFIFAEEAGRTVGYTSYGPIACTAASWDLYWICVLGDYRGKGLGTRLLAMSEEDILRRGGTRVYIETSARPLYEPTRAFYLSRGYSLAGQFEDFYGPGDAKNVYVKVLKGTSRG
jgi:GNAT superfamily N-acetyltransferase